MAEFVALWQAENIDYAKYHIPRKEYDAKIGHQFNMHLANVRHYNKDFAMLCEVYNKDTQYIYVKIY